MGLPRFVGVHPHSGIRLHHARASAGLERIALTIMSSGGPLDLSLLVGIHGSEGTDGRRFVRLHVIDFRLELDLSRFHPLKRLDNPVYFLVGCHTRKNTTIVPKIDNKRNQAHSFRAPGVAVDRLGPLSGQSLRSVDSGSFDLSSFRKAQQR